MKNDIACLVPRAGHSQLAGKMPPQKKPLGNIT